MMVRLSLTIIGIQPSGLRHQLGHLHIHPISQTHQLRPTLTYLDVISRKSRRSRGVNGAEGDSDSDDGPPPDPDDPTPAAPVVRKEKRPMPESKEVQVTAKKTSEDKTGTQQFQGGLSQVRREMLMMIRQENEEPWEELDYCDGEVNCPSFTMSTRVLTALLYTACRFSRCFRVTLL